MSKDIPLDVKSAEQHLMRFLEVEGVTGQEKAIAEAVSDELKKIGVPGVGHSLRHGQQAHSSADTNG